jgi:dynein heavy chain 1
VPGEWVKYKTPREITVEQWIADFGKRLAQIEDISNSDFDGDSLKDVWLGGLFMPEAFITASRQTIAQKNSWSLEELELSMDFVGGGADEFCVSGMRVEGAEMVGGKLAVSAATSWKMGGTVISWSKKSGGREMIDVPVYLNSDRTDVLFVASIAKSTVGISEDALVQRAIAFIAF